MAEPIEVEQVILGKKFLKTIIAEVSAKIAVERCEDIVNLTELLLESRKFKGRLVSVNFSCTEESLEE